MNIAKLMIWKECVAYNYYINGWQELLPNSDVERILEGSGLILAGEKQKHIAKWAAMGADDAAREDVWNLPEGGGTITNGREYSISCYGTYGSGYVISKSIIE